MKPIVVIGSINMDLVCRTQVLPRGGETVLGSEFVTVPGGKGANQAVAAAKLASGDLKVHMIGRVGDDDFGQRLLNGLRQHQVNTRHVVVTEGVASGIAMILVDRKGENSIVVAPGANARLAPADLDTAEETIASASVVVLQLEIPLATVRHAIAMCQRLGVYTILDPAPAPAKPLPRALFGVDLFTPNESEAQTLLQITPRARQKRSVEPKQIAGELIARGVKAVALKLGSKGSMMVSRDRRANRSDFYTAKPFKVKVIDTTAAGDAFTAGLAVAKAEGMSPSQTMNFANAAGAICCKGFGAQPSLPTRSAVEKLLQTR